MTGRIWSRSSRWNRAWVRDKKTRVRDKRKGHDAPPVILVSLPYLGLSPDDGAMIIGILVLGGIVLFQLGDLKEPTKRNYKRARRLVIGSRPPKTADLPTFYPSRTDFTVVLTGRKLIQGGTVLSLDDDVGDFTTGDVFIEGDKIVAVGSGLAAGEAEVSGRACSATSAPTFPWRGEPAV